MEQYPKILVITVSAWNSKVGANTWAALLDKYDSKNIANICIRDEVPDCSVCSRYFAISENKVIKSILKHSIKTGKEVTATSGNSEEDLNAHNQRYTAMKKHRRYSMLLARELVWKVGRWKTPELDAFLDSFQPDIILHSMEGYIHLNRIIQYTIQRTGAKAIGYIWDDNFTYKQSSHLGYKIYRFFQRKSLKRLAKKTTEFFAISEMTKQEADAFFGINSIVLTKPLSSTPSVSYSDLKLPIKMLYTGNLFIGRDRSLLRVVKAVKQLPKNSFVIDVYTKTQLSKEMLIELESDICHIHAPISQKEVLERQKQADVLLFLEDIDGPDANMARLSFSTKTTDYLSSGRCIFAVGCADTAPMQYFMQTKAAITACSVTEIADKLQTLPKEINLIEEYAHIAAQVGVTNHSREKIQEVFNKTIQNVFYSGHP